MKEFTCNMVSLVDSFSAIISSGQQNKLWTVYSYLLSYNGTIKFKPHTSDIKNVFLFKAAVIKSVNFSRAAPIM